MNGETVKGTWARRGCVSMSSQTLSFASQGRLCTLSVIHCELLTNISQIQIIEAAQELMAFVKVTGDEARALIGPCPSNSALNTGRLPMFGLSLRSRYDIHRHSIATSCDVCLLPEKCLADIFSNIVEKTSGNY
jgi:hypothetical protein